jgi:hypothetical protein
MNPPEERSEHGRRTADSNHQRQRKGSYEERHEAQRRAGT